MNENRIVLVAKEADDCYGCFFDERSGCVSNDSSVGSCTGRFRKDGRDIIWVVEQEQSRMTEAQKANVESKFSEVV